MAPTNITKLVNDHLRRGQAIAQDAKVHGKSLPGRVARALGQPQFEKPLAMLFELAVRTQAEVEAAAREADAAHLDELTDDAALRAARDQAASTLYSTLTRTRGVVESVLDRDAARKAGFVGQTPADALSLSRLAPLVISKVATLPPPEDDLVIVDFEAMAAGIAHALAPLSDVLAATQQDLRENEVTLRRRNETLAASTRAQDFVLDLLRLCASVVGDADLLHRTRPSALRDAAAPPAEPPAPVASDA